MKTVDDSQIDLIKNEEDIFKKAKLIIELIGQDLVKQNELAKKLNVKESYLSHLKRILKLPEIVIDGYYSKTLSPSHLMVLSRLKNEQDMIYLYEKVLAENLNVQQLETEIRSILFNINDDKKALTKEEKEKIEHFFKRIDSNCKVKVIQTRISAKVIISLSGSSKKTTETLKKLINPNYYKDF